MATRIEKDTFGDIEVPSDALWGALKDEGLLRRDAPTPGGPA